MSIFTNKMVAPVAVCLLMLLLCSGCRSTLSPGWSEPEESSALVWPSPPAKSRLRYIKSLRSSGDFGVELSWWRRAVNLITGSDVGREQFIYPFSLCFDEAGNVFMTDIGSSSVFFFNISEKKVCRWRGVGDVNFLNPVGVTADNGIIYVADSGLKKVIAFNFKGQLVFEIERGLERPSALLVLGNKLFVADSQLHKVKCYTLKGKFIEEYGSRGVGRVAFNYPTHLATDDVDRIYVTDSMNNRIQVLDLNGRFIANIGSGGDNSGHFARPKGVAVDKMGHIYAVDALFDNIQIFNDSGDFLLAFGERGEGPGEFWMPAGIAMGNGNLVLIADTYNKRVQMFEYFDK